MQRLDKSYVSNRVTHKPSTSNPTSGLVVPYYLEQGRKSRYGIRKLLSIEGKV